MNPFLIWLITGLISALFAIIAFFIVRLIKSQDAKNEIFFGIIGELKEAVTRLNTTLNFTDKLNEERHKDHEDRIRNLEKLAK